MNPIQHRVTRLYSQEVGGGHGSIYVKKIYNNVEKEMLPEFT